MSMTGRLDDTRRGIVEDYMPMARSMARRFATGAMAPHFGEILSAAYKGLCDASAKFDPAQGTAFAVFARPRIRGEMCDAATWLVGIARGSAAAVVEFGPVPDREAGDPGPSRDELIEEAVAFIRTLPAGLKGLARLLLIEGLSQGTAARKLGISKGYVSRLRKQLDQEAARYAA